MGPSVALIAIGRKSPMLDTRRRDFITLLAGAAVEFAIGATHFC
jgi:hypothetical protein